MIKMPWQAIQAVDMLCSAGYEAYFVGGSVRDSIMGTAVGDIDITTSALPQQVQRVFSGYKVIETGLKHGTVTVVIDHLQMEITTYRTETCYSDSRHPDSVQFTTSLKEDCARRDFTMNSVCYSPSKGIVDYYGGISDIQNRLIRCVGQPDKRFAEDALRILRAVRFVSVLGFDMEDKTRQAVFENAHLLQKISAERIYAELNKILAGKYVKKVLLEYTEVFAAFMPEIMHLKGFDQNNYHHIYDVLEHTAVVVENTPQIPQLRLAALLHDFGKPHTYTVDEKGVGHFYGHGDVSHELSENILRRLKVSNDDYSLVTHLVKYHDVHIEPTQHSVRRALNKHGRERLQLLLMLKRADNKGQNTKDFDRTKEYDILQRRIQRQLDRQRCFSLKQLAVNGDDLADIGIPPSKETGRILNALLELVVNCEIENEKTVLAEKAKQLYSRQK